MLVSSEPAQGEQAKGNIIKAEMECCISTTGGTTIIGCHDLVVLLLEEGGIHLLRAASVP